MTLQRFAKWWSLMALLGVLGTVAATYMMASGHRPEHHPWPAISVIAIGVTPITLNKPSKTWHSLYKIILSAFALALAVVVNRIT